MESTLGHASGSRFTVGRGASDSKRSRAQGQVAGPEGVEEVVEIVLMVGPAVERRPDVQHRIRPRMRRVGGRYVVLEERVMRDVVLGWTSVRRRGRTLSVAPGAPVGVRQGEVEAAHE